MDLKWSRLVTLRDGMQEPEVAAAIDVIGMRPHADHVLAHIALYGRMLGQQGGNASAGEAQANAAWNEAFRVFAASRRSASRRSPVASAAWARPIKASSYESRGSRPFGGRGATPAG